MPEDRLIGVLRYALVLRQGVCELQHRYLVLTPTVCGSV